MKERNMGFIRNKRAFMTVAIIAGILLLSVSLFSAFYVTSEANHDCCGEGCPICAHIDQCTSILRSAGDGSAILGAVLLLTAISFTAAAVLISVFCSSSPITFKVRLNN